MRFVVTGEWTRNSLLKLILVFFFFYVVFFWLTSVLLYFHKMGLDYQSVVDYYRGSEEQYTQPRSYQGMLEVAHYHLFAMGILMVTVTHLLLFIPISQKFKALMIVLCFGSALSNEASSWLVRFAHPAFAYLKILSFLTLELSLVAVVGISLYGLVTNKRSAYRDSERALRARSH
jgi:hypothetical protein